MIKPIKNPFWWFLGTGALHGLMLSGYFDFSAPLGAAIGAASGIAISTTVGLINLSLEKINQWKTNNLKTLSAKKTN